MFSSNFPKFIRAANESACVQFAFRQTIKQCILMPFSGTSGLSDRKAYWPHLTISFSCHHPTPQLLKFRVSANPISMLSPSPIAVRQIQLCSVSARCH
jgi:hypothetical protein